MLKNVISAGETRQNLVKKRSLYVINEYFEPNFNEVWQNAIVFQQPVRANNMLYSIWCWAITGKHGRWAATR